MAYSATAGDICCSRSSSLRATFLHFLGQRILLDLLAQGVDLGGGGIAFAQFALDGAHLLAQEEIALALGHAAG